jgi:hypothetical protein
MQRRYRLRRRSRAVHHRILSRRSSDGRLPSPVVRQINVALARPGILNALIQRSVSAPICRGRAVAQAELEVAARVQGLRQLAVVMDRLS